MKIKALGAVGTVTGSCFRLEMNDGRKLLLDCGLFQGGKQTELRNSNTSIYDPENLEAIVLTHAHMDHTGLVPRMVKMGFRGPIYATEATCELLEALWLDAANIQEQEAVWKSRKNRRQGKRDVEPLYTEDDARQAMSMLKGLAFDAPHQIMPGLTLRCFPAGHILGASSCHFTAEEEGEPARTIVFSGDIGRNAQLLMPAPSPLPRADTIFMETTYGNREHKEVEPSVEEFIKVINDACAVQGKILIPAFAVERTQEILLLLARAKYEKKIPQDLPVYLDSPLATSALAVYAKHTELFDEETKSFLKLDHAPDILPNLHITRDARESQELNDVKGSAIIIAGSGMANAGRILHHLKHNLWRPNCHVIFVGFQAQGTPGRRLVEGAKVVKIFREPVNVEATIHTIGGFSAHAGQAELLEWLEHQRHPGLVVNLIHGEASGTEVFKQLAEERFPEVSFHIPSWLHYVPLSPGQSVEDEEEKTDAGIKKEETEQLTLSFISRLERLKSQAAAAASLPPEQLAALEDQLNQAEALLLKAGTAEDAA